MTAQPQLSFRSRLTWCAHLFKALTRQHHLEMLPLFERHIPKNGIVIDVGAHAGQFAKLFARLAPEGHVYAFEPGSYARSIFSKVLSARKIGNISLFPVGLSDTASEETLHVPIKDSGSVGFGLSHIGHAPATAPRKMREEKIILTTLDRFVASQGLERVDLIKADIEGWEMRCLLGAQQTLEKFRPVLFLEINDAFLQRAGNTAQEMWDFLKSLHYRIDRLEEDGITLTPLSAPITSGDIWCVAEK